MYLGGPTTKKWSLPLPVVTRSSESDSASSSWSARSADEATEDERSPIPSPSASHHSGEVDSYYSLTPQQAASGFATMGPPATSAEAHSPKSAKTIDMETRKLAIKAKQSEEFVYHTQTVQQLAIGSIQTAIGGTGGGSSGSSDLNLCAGVGSGAKNAPGGSSKASSSKDKGK